jgi:hypothetical protein
VDSTIWLSNLYLPPQTLLSKNGHLDFTGRRRQPGLLGSQEILLGFPVYRNESGVRKTIEKQTSVGGSSRHDFP